jgi:uncharacterized protein YcbX
MTISEIWRYPVKTMADEKLRRAAVGPLGIEGDRIVHVEDGRDRVLTSRSHPGFLGHKATLGDDGEPLVDGRPWKSPAVAADVKAIAGTDSARLVRDESAERFDVLPTRDIYRRFEGKLALNCFVIEAGSIAVGDEVELVRGRACTGSTGTAVFAD